MGEFLKVTKVEVISAVDLGELEKTIAWLVSRVQDLPPPEQSNQKTIADSLLQDQVDALRRENSSLKDALAQLQSKQEELESRLDAKQDRDQSGADATAAAPSEATADLERRLTDLEQRVGEVASAAASSATGKAPVAGDAGAVDPQPAGFDLGAQLQELLAGHRALAATVSGLQQDLEAKPSRGELDLKANRSELDALLCAGATPAAVGDAAGAAAAPLALPADGSLDGAALAVAVNKAAADLAALRGQLAVLQDRMQAKAEQGSLDDLAAQVAALKAKGAAGPGFGAAAAPGAASRRSSDEAATAAPITSSVLQTLAPSLHDLKQRLDDLEVRVASAGPSVAADPDESSSQAVDAIDTLADVQPLLKDIYARVDSKADRSALEDALRRVQELAAALSSKADAATLRDVARRVAALPQAAAASGPTAASTAASSVAASRSGTPPTEHPERQWIVSHELAEHTPTSALEELRVQLADLADRVAKLAPAAPSTPPGEDAPAPLAGRASGTGDGAAAASAGAGVSSEQLASLQGALSALQGQLGELGTRLAGKADAGEVARLELALNGKADVEELEGLRLALAGKADAAALSDLQMTVAGKADQAALEEVKLAAALAADLAAAGNAANAGDGSGAAAEGGESNGGNNGGYSNLLGAIQNMVADKASKEELAALQGQVGGKASADDVAALRAALDDKAPAAELSALASQLSRRVANAAEIASLDERMGDVFAELAKIRADLAALPSPEALAAAATASAGAAAGRDGSGAGDTSALQRMVSALSREMGTLREGLDTVAHAANVLAVGLDGGVRSSMSGLGSEARRSETGGKENRSPRGGYERLVKLLGSGDYRHKMDAFDPTALQQMAQKLAFLEATMKSPAMGRIGAGLPPANGVDYGVRELERQVKRLATDVRVMKDKLIDPAPVMTGGKFLPPGDHAMLAGRPITGYRCMACDRPLDVLDSNPGPHIPTQQLPTRTPAVADPIRAQVRSGRGDPLSPQSSAQRLQYNTDPNVRGVQNWYKDTQGMAAEVLPPAHVGPHLPPGGWRPSNPGQPSNRAGAVTPNALPAVNGPKSQKSSDFAGQPADGAVTLPQIP